MPRAVGIDFGTTNSALAVVGEDGRARLARHRAGDRDASVFRSVLYFHTEQRERSGRLVPSAGPRAMEHYLESGGEGRLMQSLKSFLASRLFTSTNVFGAVLSLETLIAYLLRALRAEAEATFGEIGTRAVVGRPVRFAGAAEPRDEELALARLRAAFQAAGWSDVEFELEPVAAAWHYEQGLDHDELVLIGDFGGGTSDFCLLRVGPGVRAARDGRAQVLATSGVALAGDAFDGRIVRHVVAPHLGQGSEFESIFGRVLPVPSWIYRHLERWHHLAFLRSPETLRLLYDLRRDAKAPERLDALLHVVDHDLGFPLHRSVEGAKLALSAGALARFHFADGPIEIEEPVLRDGFEEWIAGELASIRGCVEELLQQTGIAAREVDRVFLTGGSSLVPAVRAIFAERFGEGKLRSGAELTSVASGLALRAAG
jgi:hypothetical chaperone protein